MSGKSASLALIPFSVKSEPLPEISAHIYRRKSATKAQDRSYAVISLGYEASNRLPTCRNRLKAVFSSGEAARIPLLPTSCNYENVPRQRREGSSLSSKSISPLKEKQQVSKGKSVTPGPKPGQENAQETRLQRPKPPSARKTQTYQRVRHLLGIDLSKLPTDSAPVLTIPSSPQKWEHSARLCLERRADMGERPLLIVHFAGVVGDFFSPEVWTSPAELFLRPGWVKGIHALQQCMQVALFIDLPRGRFEKLRQALRNSGVRVDAVYRQRKRSILFEQNYAQTLSDFGLCTLSSSHVMVLSALQLDQTEISTRHSWELLYDKSLSSHRRICTYGLPASENNVSVMWLVPNPRAQEGHLCIGMEDIAIVIVKLVECGMGSVVRGFEYTAKSRQCQIATAELAIGDWSVPVLLPVPDFSGSEKALKLLVIPPDNFPLKPYVLIEAEDTIMSARKRHQSFQY